MSPILWNVTRNYSKFSDYFNMLEQSCEMVEDILIMPEDLQADVIVPIVNFMYTGKNFIYFLIEIVAQVHSHFQAHSSSITTCTTNS